MNKFCLNKTNLELLDHCICELENIIEKNLSLDINLVKIYNDHKNENNLRCLIDNRTIYLNIEDEDIGQIIYQLSHELMHHIIYQVEGKTNKYNGKESKAEETLCTAFSFFCIEAIRLWWLFR